MLGRSRRPLGEEGESERGMHDVEIVHAENPQKAIMEYYRAGREGKLGN